MPPKTTPPKLQPDILLAKSSLPGSEDWRGTHHLIGHTAAVVESVTTLVDTLGLGLIQQFGLDCKLEVLRATARLAAYLHDWGKANDHFQMVVRNDLKSLPRQYRRDPRERPQMIRHEVASMLIAWEFQDWLKQCPDADFMMAIATAGGHHLKLGGKQGKDTSELGEVREGTGDTCLYWYVHHSYFHKLIRYGVRNLGLPNTIPPFKFSQRWELGEIKREKRQAVLNAFENWEPHTTLLAVLKALLVAGDAIGSASAQVSINIYEWIEKQLIGTEEESNTLTEEDLQRVIDARRGNNPLRQFQVDLKEKSARVTMARAGCGTGKTLGAYNWAQKHAIGRKLFFCYPTTGTSTEGFLDYVQDEVESVLLHSRSEVDLELARTGEEIDNGDETINETAQKLDSFKAWGAKVSICTVDTVLGLLQCNRRPLYCFPAIANAAFVFDEVHCYDDALFGALLRFLKVVKAPILLMSASFLPAQVKAIRAAVGEPVEIIHGPQDIERQPRYRFHEVEQPDWQRVQQELANGGKVLWVCNQVNTAIAVYEQAKSLGLNALLYHSRFRYGDRVQHHRAVVDGFKHDQPILAVATQVAEMSLDLSATLLVTQIADPAGLIQRLGRLNRGYCDHALDAIFYPEDPKMVGFPYSQDQLDSGLALVRAFSGEVNQAQLATWLEKLNIQSEPKDHFVLLDGKWRTYPAPLREAGYTVTALLKQDEATIAHLKSSDLPRYTVPLPARNIKGWPRHKKGYLIAPADQWGYSSELGAFELKRR
ncbi:CRISPR-associated helicase Cas3' [Leptodesmis sp.]|uniref:CRISPR-associated helicase Cas3' n=1 Tax=Leptodesmis sp. TaxID=3100501 RepID=UPI00405350A3